MKSEGAHIIQQMFPAVKSERRNMTVHLCPHCKARLSWLHQDDGLLAYYCTNCDEWFTMSNLRYWDDLEYRRQFWQA
jgi:transposase